MSSSSLEFYYDSSSSSENMLSMTTRLLDESLEEDGAHKNNVHNVIQSIIPLDYSNGSCKPWKVNATRKGGLSPLQKVTAAIQMLAYGYAANALDEYVQIGETTAIKSLKRFCTVIIGLFDERYLRKSNNNDIEMLLKEGEAQGFPEKSQLFDDLINDVAPPYNFIVQGHQYDMGYYLSDGIYPQYATLIQEIFEPSCMKEKTFSKHQEAVRKDVEWAFRVLQSRWHIIKGPTLMWRVKDLGNIMKTCIILHNIVKESIQKVGNLMVANVVEDAHPNRDYAFLVSRMINRMNQVQDKRVHNDLNMDLVNYLWELHGDEQAI